jgi:hypothetical protein
MGRNTGEMMGQVHFNHALYTSSRPQPGDLIKNVVIVEEDRFQVRILRGCISQTEPDFRPCPAVEVEVHFHLTLEKAQDDAVKEVQESISTGWKPFNESVLDFIHRLRGAS